ncbi:ornithine cyclodeaminase family protein [Psychromicrobium lacuslunae]|uniref:Crystallin n=1 Tax=Psychromicrobium lacuslunae TaxID=1618207 RepID=A0A0D4BZU3_9MICC|nr:hypothetical protein [Psychromicrobium lacuslunae]AJT41967.1 crystallin [Psychromicrobium lacuslunae]
MSLSYFDAEAVRAALPWHTAVTALHNALRQGVDPEQDSPRIFSPAPGGEFLLMPTTGSRYSGLKALTVAPENPARGLQKIQGIYLLIDSETLSPLATMDGNELTAIRTPAVTLLAVSQMLAAAPGGEPTQPKLLIFGAGVQALNHFRAANVLLPQATDFAVLGQRPERVQALIRQLNTEGIQVRPAEPSEVSDADIILCTTSSRTPLFDGNSVAPGTIVAAIGQHGLDAREVDAALVRRSDVVVESRTAAWREAGDLIPARSVSEWQSIQPANLQDLVNGKLRRNATKPCLYNGVGMAWEDLVMATVVYEGGSGR